MSDLSQVLLDFCQVFLDFTRYGRESGFKISFGVLNFDGTVADLLPHLVAALAVKETDELMLMTSKGQSVRIRVGGEKGIRETGRNAQGVKLMDLREGEVIQDVALVAAEEDVPEAPAELASDAVEESPAGELPASEGSEPEAPTAES